MAAAREYVAKNDSTAAMIELKTLLQRKPQAAEARYLLGKMLFETGDLAAAEDELGAALQHGYPEEEVAPLLAEVLVAVNRSMAVLQRFGNLEFADHGAATADLKVQVAKAHIYDGKFNLAEQAIGRALSLSPEHPEALALQARLTAIKGDTATAKAQVDDLLTRMPKNASAWALRGDLLMMTDSAATAQALQAHRTALSLRPRLVQSHAALLSMLLAQNDLEAAAKQWAELQSALPSHPQRYFFEAVLALRKGDAERTKAITHRMLESSPFDLRLLLLAGQAEMQLGTMEQAEALLSKAVRAAPAAASPRHLLAEVHLRNGRAENALAVLEPLLAPGLDDAFAMILAGRAHLIAGNPAGADKFFSRAVALKPDDRRIRTAAAVAQLTRSQSEAAFAAVEAIAKVDDDTTADLALISGRLGRREFAAALRAVDGLAAKVPKQALPDHLRGRIALAAGDAAAARAHFSAGLVKEPGYFASVANLVALDLVEGKAGAARTRLETMRQREPGNAQVRLALATLLTQTGGSAADVGKLLDEAIKAKPSDPATHAALIDHLLRTGDRDQALAAAQAAVLLLPSNLSLLDKLASVHIARGEMHLATATYNNMNTLHPEAALPHLRLAEAFLATRKIDAAADKLRLAQQAAPRSLAVQKLAIVLAIRQKRPAQALAIARSVQSQRPNDVVGHLLEGDIELTLRNYDAAVAAFRKVVAKPDAPEAAGAAKHLYLALVGAGKLPEANQWADTWLAQHRDDTAFIVQLADVAIGRGDLVQAELRYRDVLKLLPDNPLAMSNVAYTMAKLKKPGALALAEQAAKLAPNDSAVLDTLATAYAEGNQLDKAIEWQGKAVQLSPQSGGLRLNLAKLYLRADEREKAVVELDRLAQLGKSFGSYSEVAQLRKKLGP